MKHRRSSPIDCSLSAANKLLFPSITKLLFSGRKRIAKIHSSYLDEIKRCDWLALLTKIMERSRSLHHMIKVTKIERTQSPTLFAVKGKLRINI